MLKKITHPAGANTHKHLDEFRTGNREERHAGFPCHRLGEQGFTGSWRAYQQHPFGNFGANCGEAIWVLEEVDDFSELELGSLNTGHIAESHLSLRLHLKPRLALTKIHCLIAATTLGAAQQEKQTAKQQ